MAGNMMPRSLPWLFFVVWDLLLGAGRRVPRRRMGLLSMKSLRKGHNLSSFPWASMA